MDISTKNPSCDDLNGCLWEWRDLSRALKELGRRSSLLVRPVAPFVDEGFDEEPDSINRWIELNAEYLGVEVEEKDVSLDNLEAVLRSVEPGLIEITAEGKHGFLALLKGRRGILQLLGRGGTVHKVPVERIDQVLRAEIASPCLLELERILETARIPMNRRRSRVNAFFKECSTSVRIHGVWQVRLAGGASFWRQMCDLKLPARLFRFLSLYLLKYVL